MARAHLPLFSVWKLEYRVIFIQFMTTSLPLQNIWFLSESNGFAHYTWKLKSCIFACQWLGKSVVFSRASVPDDSDENNLPPRLLEKSKRASVKTLHARYSKLLERMLINFTLFLYRIPELWDIKEHLVAQVGNCQHKLRRNCGLFQWIKNTA